MGTGLTSLFFIVAVISSIFVISFIPIDSDIMPIPLVIIWGMFFLWIIFEIILSSRHNAKYYKANISCDNCDYLGDVDVLKGKPVSSVTKGMKCPKCHLKRIVPSDSDEDDADDEE